MSRARFLWANVAGAVLWALTFTLIGTFASEWWRSSSDSVQVILAAGLASVAGTWFALTRSNKEAAPDETGAASSRSPEEVGGGRNSKTRIQAR